ncbi:hypothetical protein Mapa_007495 [Marchantia paleacea]|nr:hypothetical protein Mapa_007495 [Marchantia paleacea]
MWPRHVLRSLPRVQSSQLVSPGVFTKSHDSGRDMYAPRKPTKTAIYLSGVQRILCTALITM